MTRLQGPLKNLGMVNVPDAGSIDAIEQFANTIRPVWPLTTLTVQSGQLEGDFGVCLVSGANYGKLMRLSAGVWVNATPTTNLEGYIETGQIRTAAIVANHMAVDAVTAACISAGAIDGLLITGATIRTGSSNPRVIIDSTYGLRALNSSGTVWLQIPVSGNTLFSMGVSPSPEVSAGAAMTFGGDASSVAVSAMLQSQSGGSAVIAYYLGTLVQFVTQNTERGSFSSSGLTLSNSSVGIQMPAGCVVKINDLQVLGARGSAIADATDAATTMARLNDLLAACRTHGLIAT